MVKNMNAENNTPPEETTGLRNEEVFLDDDLEGPKLSAGKILATFLIVTIAASGFFLLAWYAYRNTSKPTDVASLETVKADTNPTKVKPEEPGGMVVPNMDKTIYDHISNSANNDNLPKVERLLPSPEEPVDRKTLAETPQADAAKTPASEAHPPAEATAKDAAKEPVATTTPAKEVATPRAVADASVKPAPKPQEAAASLKEVSNDDLKLVPEGKASTKQEPQKKAAAASSGTKIQLASVKSEKDALATWNKMKKTHSELLGNLGYFVERKDLGSKGVFYRLQAGPISGTSNARLLCKKLTELGQGCLVVK
jgi:hypothetical protein